MPRALPPILLALASLTPSLASAQLLDRASSAVHDGGWNDDDDDDGGGWSSDDDDDDDYEDQGGGGSLLDAASSAAHGSSGGRPYRGGGSSSSSGGLTGCVLGVAPYADGTEGYSQPAVDPTGQAVEARFASRLSAEVGYALGGAARGGAAVRLAMPLLLDVTARYSFFLEGADDGIRGAALGRVGAELRLFEGPLGQLRLGAGVRHFHDVVGGEIGADGLLAFDLFPIEPLVISGELTAGGVGQATVLSARATIGLMIDATEVYVGYHYEGLFAGGQHVDLGGPTLGVRAWL